MHAVAFGVKIVPSRCHRRKSVEIPTWRAFKTMNSFENGKSFSVFSCAGFGEKLIFSPARFVLIF